MKKLLTMVAVLICISLSASTLVSAVEINSYSEDLTVYCNNQNVYATSENKPCIINDRTMVPLRPIFEAMGWSNDSIIYDAAAKTASFDNNGISCVFENESAVAIKYLSDGTQQEYILDVPATIYNGNFYIPIRAFCDIWKMDIQWEHSTRSVYIQAPVSENIPDTPAEKDEFDEADRAEPEIDGDVPIQSDETVSPPELEAKDLTEADAVAKVQDLVGDDFSTHLEYTFEYDGRSYYQIAVRIKVLDELTGETHTSRASSYIVSFDGEEIFEGYYNQETGTLSNYEENADETMAQE